MRQYNHRVNLSLLFGGNPMFRRISALLLCIVMIIGMLPVSAFAEEPAAPESSETMPLPEETSAPTDPVESEPPATEPATEPQQTEPTPTETPATEPVPVETEPTPTEVVITDEVMDEIIDETGAEFWQNLDPSAANVLIPDGVTYIPDRAFKDFTNLKSVYIPASVTTTEILGTYYESPFFGCSSDVVIYCESASAPASWDSNWNKYSSNSSLTVNYGWCAADYTFWKNVDNTASILVIPDGVTRIPQSGFRSFQNLQAIYIPDTVTNITANYSYPVFSGNPSIYCAATTKPAGWDDGWNYVNSSFLGTSFGCSLTEFNYWTTLDKSCEILEIPTYITFIPSYAFVDSVNLRSVTIHDNLTSIGDYAFDGCTGLTTIYIPKSVTSLGFRAFVNCSLTIYCEAVSTPATWNGNWNDRSLHNDNTHTTYFGCTALDVTYWSTLDKDTAFIEIPEGITFIPDYAFMGHTNITEVHLPSTIRSIGYYAFESCSNLVKINLPAGLTMIGESAFDTCSSLKEITIPDGITKINHRTFQYCSSLTTVSIPASVTSIGNEAFEYCIGLRDLSFGHMASDELSFGDYAFYASTPSSIYFPLTIHVPTTRDIHREISNDSFTYYTVTYDYTGNIPATGITLTEANDTTEIEAGLDLNFTAALTPADTTSELVWTASNGGIVKESDYVSGTATIIGVNPGTMTVRCESADDNSIFAEYEVEILNPTADVAGITVRSDTPYENEVEVGTQAQMISDIYPGNAAVKEVIWELENGTGTAELDENGLLTALTPGTVTVYATATDGTEIIGSATVNIVRYVDNLTLLFNGDPTKTTIGVGEPVMVRLEHFPDDATNKAVTWTLTDGTGSISKSDYGDSYILIKGNTVGTATLTATTKDSKKTAVSVELEVVGEKASYAVTGGNIYYNTVTGAIVGADSSVTAANIPARINSTTITSIAPDAFVKYSWGYYTDNTTLTSVTIPSTVTCIGEAAFCNCTKLASLRLGSNVTTIGKSAFYNCKSLANLTIPESVTSIGDSAFYSLESLQNLTIPGNLDTRDWLHYGLYESLLKTVTFTGTTIIGQPYVDYGNGSSEMWYLPGRDANHVIISDSITSIGDYAFCNHNDIEQVTMGSGVSSIGTSAFEGCDKITSLDLPDSLTHIGKDAFRYCRSLPLIDLSAVPDTVTQQNFPLTYDLAGVPDVLVSATGRKIELNWDTWSIDGESGQASIYRSGSTNDYFLEIYNTGKVKLQCYDEYTGVQGFKVINCELGLEIDGLYFNYLTAGQSVILTAYRPDTNAEESVTWSLRGEDKAYASLSATSGKSTKLTAKAVTKATQIQITAKSGNPNEAPETRTVWILPAASGVIITDTDGNVLGKTGTTVQTIKVDLRETTSIKLFATTYPEGASTDVWWDSSNYSVANPHMIEAPMEGYESQSPLVTLTGTGTATLTAYANDGSGKYATVKLEVYYLDPATKFTAKTTAPATGLVDSHTAQIQIFGTDKNVPLDPNAFNYVVKAGQEEMAYIDDNGVITAGGTSGTVTITATTKNDPKARKVIVNVKIIPAQTESILLTATAENSDWIHLLDANGERTDDPTQAVKYRVYLDQNDVLTGKATFQIKPVVTDTNGNPATLTKSSLKWTSTDTRVASVVSNTDGSATVTIPAKTDGACVITAASTDLAKVESLLEVFVRDYTPRLENSKLTLNSNLTAGVSTGLTPGYGNEILGVELYDSVTTQKSQFFTPAYEDGILTITPNSVLKNGSYNLIVKALCGDNRSYDQSVTIKIANKLPAVTVKQLNKFNLFYSDSTADLQITVKGETIRAAALELTGTSSFCPKAFDPATGIMTVEFTPTYVDGTSGKLLTKVNLQVKLEGYREPITKSISIATVTTKPTVTLTPASSIINTAMVSAHSTTIGAYNKTTGTDVPIGPEDVTATFADVSANGDGVKLTLPEGSKGGSATVLVQDTNWMLPIKLTHKVTVQKTLPVVNLSAATLKLNRIFAQQSAAADITLNQRNMSIGSIAVEPDDKTEKLLTESSKITISVSGNTITARLNKENLPANGNYSYRVLVTLSDGTPLAAKSFKVNVNSAVPTVKLKTSTLKLNRVLGKEYAVAGSEFVLANGTGYEIAGFALPDTWSNQDIAVEYRNGMVYARLLRSDAAATKHTLALTPVLRHTATGEESSLPTSVKLTVQVESKTPTVNITAAGKLDATLPGSAITYTVKSFTNVSGTPSTVTLEGAHGELFNAALNTNGTTPVVTLKMRDDIKYDLKTTYKVDLVFAISGQQVRKSVTFKISQSALKFAAVKTVNLYQFQSQAANMAITVTAPTGATIDQITLSSKSALQFRHALGNGSMTVTPIGDGSSALVSFTLENPGYLSFGKSYAVYLDVTPVTTANTVKPAQVKLTVKSFK